MCSKSNIGFSVQSAPNTILEIQHSLDVEHLKARDGPRALNPLTPVLRISLPLDMLSMFLF